MRIHVPLTVRLEVDTDDVEHAKRIAEECRALMMRWFPYEKVADGVIRNLPIVTYVEATYDTIVVIEEEAVSEEETTSKPQVGG